MKILHLISGGDTGGAKTHVLSLIKELDKQIDAKIICFIEDEFYRDGKKLGINIEVYKQKKRYDLTIIKKLINEIKNNNYDIIHCHGARANFIAFLLNKFVNVPFITTIHSDYKLDFRDNFYKKIVYTFLNEISLKIFDYYIAVSSEFKRMLMDRGFDKDRIFTVYNGIDFDEEINIILKDKFLESYNIDFNDKILVGILARLDLVKNHEMFIHAAAKVLDKRDDVRFIIAGDGNEKKRLTSLVEKLNIKDKIKFLGRVDKPDSFFNAIDINVLTSNSESFPYVILEGARQMKMIISTDVGGIKDLVKNNHNGFLINVGDYKKLAKLIDELLDDRDKIIELGNNLYKDAKENFSLSKMGKDHIEIYNLVIKNRR